MDKPLNNLDHNNVRIFSNILTMIYREKPEFAILIVTHCRSIPIVNKVIKIDSAEMALKIGTEYVCSSCFGKIDRDELYYRNKHFSNISLEKLYQIRYNVSNGINL